MNVASRRPSGSIRSTPESVATATRSPQRVAATSLPAGSGRLVGGWSAAAVISLGGSAATSRWSAAPNICSGTAGSGWGQATRTRRAAETTRPLPSTVYSVPSGPSVACSIATATVSTRALPRSSASTSLLSVVSLFSLFALALFFLVVSFWGVVTYRNSASASSPITRRTWGSRPRIAVGISAMPGRR